MTVRGDEHLNPPTSSLDQEFSLVVGGPLYQLLIRARLLRPPFEGMQRGMVVIPALAWLPLLVLTLMEGTAVGGVRVPFLQDIEAYARFLIAMPILIGAELVVHRHLRRVIWNLRERNIVPAAAMPQFEAALEKVAQSRSSMVGEIVLLFLVLSIGPWVWYNGLALKTDTWYANTDTSGVDVTGAGMWFIHISAPMFQFLVLRWYLRLAIWWRFLWQVSRLPLDLNGLHPDRSGGIGFLGQTVSGFMPMLFAQSVAASGMIASRVFTGESSAVGFAGEIAMAVLMLVAMVVIPLLFFIPSLVTARNVGLRKYGRLASAYVREFEQKWLQHDLPQNEPLIGNADIQTLADLASSSDIVSDMRTVPFSLRTFLKLVLVTSIPFFPLVLTVIPFHVLLRDAVQLLL